MTTGIIARTAVANANPKTNTGQNKFEKAPWDGGRVSGMKSLG